VSLGRQGWTLTKTETGEGLGLDLDLDLQWGLQCLLIQYIVSDGMTAGQCIGRGGRGRSVAQLPPLTWVEVARPFGWPGSPLYPFLVRGKGSTGIAGGESCRE
jgi:hypothetical protein